MGRQFRRSRRGRDGAVPPRPLEDLLEEMHDLRLTLAADLTAAAGAADVGAEHVAREIIEADQRELARFARVADLRLTRLASAKRPEPVAAGATWRRRISVALPVVPVVGAVAFSAAAATGVLPLPGTSHPAPRVAAHAPASAEPVTTTFAQLVDVLDGDPSASQVIAVAARLHEQLRSLINATHSDPGRAAEVATLLRAEQSLLLRAQPPGASIVLSATRKLAARLRHVAPELSTPSIAPSVVPTAPPSSSTNTGNQTPKHATSPSPAPKKSAKPSPSSSSSPSSSPSPSQSPFPAIPDN